MHTFVLTVRYLGDHGVHYPAAGPRRQQSKAFWMAPLGGFGSSGAFVTDSAVTLSVRRTIRPIDDFDASFVKRFVIHDTVNLEFLADGYNVFNHPQFTPGQLNNIGFSPFVGASIMNLLTPGSPAFGNAAEAFGINPRTLQLALRLMF